MKISILLLFIGFFTFTLSAQDTLLLNKKGRPMLPQKGDIGVGLNALPIFGWIGTALGGNPGLGGSKFIGTLGNTSVMLRSMISEKKAIRVHFGINHYETFEQRVVFSDQVANVAIEDSRTQKITLVDLGVGLEWRRGWGRLRGYYGGDIALGLDAIGGVTYRYGNSFTRNNPFPTSTLWDVTETGRRAFRTETRVQSSSDQIALSVLLRPFLGIEYFVASRISLGAELGWGMGYTIDFGYNRMLEFYDFGSDRVNNIDESVQTSGNLSIRTDNLNGAVFVFFYF